ncbi:hypothetical protein SAMD00019534_094930, partial [Acytostelium subglobosum LB1]|uniref:hypothetical protein n=1 Tax=Acytostelium subglobosum LB1 TaxID=1410327 RepID=UPI000644D239
MESTSTYSHVTNYHNDTRSPGSQLATQHPLSPPNQTRTILSLLQDGKMNIAEITANPDNANDCLLKSLFLCINQLLAVGDQVPNNYNQFLPDNMRLPMITIDLYIARILKYSPCSKECFITILMYIDRLITKRNFVVNSYNIHRILITSILVAAKYLDDIFYNNHFYSQVGGVSVKEINVMELDFLKLLSFDVSIKLESFVHYAAAMELYCKKMQTQLNMQSPIALPISIPKNLLPQQDDDISKGNNKSNSNSNSSSGSNTDSNSSNSSSSTNNNKDTSVNSKPLSKEAVGKSDHTNKPFIPSTSNQLFTSIFIITIVINLPQGG